MTIFRTRRLRLLAGALALAAGGPAPAQAATLFRDAPTVAVAAAPSGQRASAVKREKLVVVDEAALVGSVIGTAVGSPDQRVAQSDALAEPLTIPLFGGRSAKLRSTGAEPAVGGGLVWNGAGKGRDDFAILVVDAGRVTGAVEVDGRSYRIEPAGPGGLHRLVEVDLAKFTGDRHLQPPKVPVVGSPAGSSLAPTAIRTITLLAAYDAQAKSILGSPSAKIQLDVSLTNRSLANSAVAARIKLVGTTYASGYKPDSNEPLMRLTFDPDTWAKAIRAKRNTLKADLVTFYVGKRPYCGIAWVNSMPSIADFGYSAINSECTGSKTLAHELGHNMGLLHDRYVEPKAVATKYNYGYVTVAGKMQDIMAYPNKCIKLGVFDCKNVWYYSSPRVKIGAYALGIPKGTAGAADAARLLNENAASVSAFR